MDDEMDSSKLAEWLPDGATAALVDQLFEASQQADDLADGDVAPTAEALARLLHLCLVEIPGNPRFVQLWPCVAPILSAALQQWAASEVWRSHADQDVRRWGWAMRDALEQIIPVIATRILGFEQGQKVAVEVGEFYRSNADRESCEEWEIRP